MPQAVGTPQAAIVRPAWPTIIGTLSMVMGGLLLTTLVPPLLALPHDPGLLQRALTGALAWTGFLAGTAGAVSGGLLMAGGVLLLRRAESARVVHLIWGGVAVACAVAGASMMAAIYLRSGFKLDMRSYVNLATPRIGQLLYPVFVLLWFFPNRAMTYAACGAARRSRPTWQRTAGWVSIMWGVTQLTRVHFLKPQGVHFSSTSVYWDAPAPILALLEAFFDWAPLALPLLIVVAGIVLFWRVRLGMILHVVWAIFQGAFCSLVVVATLERARHGAQLYVPLAVTVCGVLVEMTYPAALLIGLRWWWRAGQREVQI